MIKYILDKIEANKEILSTLPRNNSKNIEKYSSKLNELKAEYGEYKETIIKEIERRYNKIIPKEKPCEIENIKKQIIDIEKILYLFNDVNTSYEKMGLDRSMHKLNKFYKENLETVNNTIIEALNRFEEVGIRLKPEDFNYSKYSNEYMHMFFQEITNGDIHSCNIQNKFEELYWKCTDIITHIELNFRYLYMKNKKTIDKYFKIKKDGIVKELDMDFKNIIQKYKKLKIKLDENLENDKNGLTNKFLCKTLNASNFTETKIIDNYSKFIPIELLKTITRNDLKEIYKNIVKCLHSVEEYQQYLEFRFVVEKVKREFNDREKYKSIYNETIKEIHIKEKSLKKLNRKINKKGIFSKNKNVQQKTEYNALILELKSLYKDLDKHRVYNKIYTDLDENSTIYDVLFLASSFYDYLYRCINENDDELLVEEIERKIARLKEFIKSPYNTIINNVTLLEQKDLSIVIKDRYRLVNLNLEMEDLEEENLESLITSLKTIKTGYKVESFNINVEDLKYLCEFKNILADRD